MVKPKQGDFPSIYPLKGEHKKPEHVKQPEPVPDKNVSDVAELSEQPQIEEVPIQLDDPVPMQEQPIEPPIQIQQRPEIYPARIKKTKSFVGT